MKNIMRAQRMSVAKMPAHELYYSYFLKFSFIGKLKWSAFERVSFVFFKKSFIQRRFVNKIVFEFHQDNVQKKDHN
jgi:hypothetical protein